MRLNDSEWTVMQAVWAGDGPVTARQVHAAVEDATDWSYSTVRTLLTRLAEKGAVSEERQGKQLVYAPTLERDEARRSALRSLVDKAFGGAFGTLVQHLAEEERLSEKERAELVRLLDEADGEDAKSRRARR